MGTWGTGIFDDDTTCDMRGHYRMALRAGVPGPQATDQILRDYAPGPDPFDTRVWLGLAATQTQLGRLEEQVKTKAVEIIDSGADLAAWDEADAATRRRRRAALQRLRRRLLGPSDPRAAQAAMATGHPLQPGQHLLFRFPDGQQVLLRVLDVQEFSLETTEGTLPVVMLLDWRTGQPLPVGPALDHVPNALRWGALWFSVIRKGRRDGVADRIQVLPGRWPEAPFWSGVNGSPIYTWDELQSKVPW
jgi:hypothetical protein